jgi:uncharacterized membrane protein
MGKLSDARMLGGIGSILQIIPLISVVGYILTLIAVKYVSDEVNDSSIFTDMLYAVITGIVGILVGGFIIFFGVMSSLFTTGLSAIAGGIAFLAIAWVVLVLSAVFVRRAFNKMADKLNVGTFRTAGMLYFVGALLTIIIVGFLILFIAFILQVVAFFSIPEDKSAPQAQMPAQAGFKYCPNCGSQLPLAAGFCPKCGAKQP